MKLQAQLLAIALMLSSPIHVAAGQWQLGVAAETSQTPIQQYDTDTTALPLINYIGETFTFTSGELSYQLIAGEDYKFSLVAAPRSEGYQSADSPALSGMEKRKSGFDMGVEAATEGAWGVLQLEITGDISDTHDGSEVIVSYRYPSSFARWMIEPAVGIALQSKQLVDYYYGVRRSEATLDRGYYEGREAENRFAEINVGYQIKRNWLALGGMRAEILDKSIVESPIVNEDYTVSVYLGVLYSF